MMGKVEIRKRIKEALVRENGYAPASRQIEGLRTAYTIDGIRSWFRIGECEYVFVKGEVRKIARGSTGAEAEEEDRE